MLNIEEVKLMEVKNLRMLRVMNNWKGYKSCASEFNDKFPTSDMIRTQTGGRYIRISCPNGYYMKFPKINGEQLMFTTSSDDNYKNDKLSVYSNKPSEFLIELSDSLVSMDKCDTLLKKFVVYVMSNSNDKVEKYGLVLALEYKNNGRVGNPYFSIEASVAVHHFSDRSILFNTIDITFGALLIYQLIIWFSNRKIDISSYGYVEVGVLIAYITQLHFRAKYVENTYINLLIKLLKYPYLRLLKRKKIKIFERNFTEIRFKKEIYNQKAEWVETNRRR